MSDNEHSTPSLGDSEESRVQHSPANAIPELGQRREYDGEIAATVRGKKSGYVLDEKPAGAKRLSDSCELEEEGAAGAFESCASAGDAEVLAGEASAEEVNTVGTLCPRPRFACSDGATPSGL
jgi:hypothetical protein